MTHARKLGTAFILVLGLGEARAADGPDLGDLQSLLSEPIISTTSAQMLGTATESPGITTVITSTDLRRYGIYTFAEAIDFLSVGMQTANALSTITSGADTVGSRGVLIQGDNINHVLFLINGRPEATAIRYPGGMPLELIDHIEITLGPGSVLYGTGAMLGLINIVLKRAKDFQGTRIGFESGITTYVRPWAGVGYQFKLFGVDSEISSQLEYYRQWGPSIPYGTENTGYSNGSTVSDNVLARYTTSNQGTGIWGGTDNQNAYQSGTGILQLRFGNLEVLGRLVLTGGSFEGFPHDFGNPDNRIDTQTYSLGVRHRATLSPVVQMVGRLYGVFTGQQSQYYNTAQFVPPLSILNFNKQAVDYGDTDIEVFFDWLKDGRLITLFGFEGRVDYARTQSAANTLEFNNTNTLTTKEIGPYSDGLTNNYRWTASPYVQQTWKVASWFGFNAGLRMDLTEKYDPFLSPRVALSLNPWKNGTVKLSYSRAFRAPTLIEAGSSGPIPVGTDEGVVTVTTPAVTPETVSSFEGSLEQKFGVHRWLFGVFQSTWSDLIAFVQNQNLMSSEGVEVAVPSFTKNLNSISNVGFQGMLQGSFLGGKLSYAVTATGAVARQSSPGRSAVPLAEAPRLYGNARIAYELPEKWPTIALATYYSSRRPADNAFVPGLVAGTPGFSPTPYAPAQLVMRATLTGEIPKLRGLFYRASANYAVGKYDPFLVGPVQLAQSGFTAPLLLPTATFLTTLGVYYNF